jgi:hypothetical protein
MCIRGNFFFQGKARHDHLLGSFYVERIASSGPSPQTARSNASRRVSLPTV